MWDVGDRIGRRGAVVVAAALLGALLGSCGDDEGDDVPRLEGAEVAFIAPKDGETYGSTVTARVEVEGFELTRRALGKPPVPGEGHLRFVMDEGYYDEPQFSGANGELAKRLGVDGQYSPATEPIITYRSLPPGDHTLEVFLVNNDHSETGVSERVKFEVE
jgi:hypothetical protein